MASVVFQALQTTIQPTWRCGVQPVRGMATLKAISMRLKSVKNIQKITKSMKMVSAAKYAKAERELQPARVYGQGAAALYEKAELASKDRKSKHLVVAVSSDRGLCGSIHTNIAKNVKAVLAERPKDSTTSVVCIGDKVRNILQRQNRQYISMVFTEVGRRPPVFMEASWVAQEILNSGYEYDSAEIVYSKFKTVVSYLTTQQPLVPLRTLTESEKMAVYDDVDDDVLRCYHEMTLANLIFYAMKEAACSEQSSRMTAMDGASKNAKEMISKLTLTYNRTRQAVITRELIEIISGAAALV